MGSWPGTVGARTYCSVILMRGAGRGRHRRVLHGVAETKQNQQVDAPLLRLAGRKQLLRVQRAFGSVFMLEVDEDVAALR